jgi:hypothetical protein
MAKKKAASSARKAARKAAPAAKKAARKASARRPGKAAKRKAGKKKASRKATRTARKAQPTRKAVAQKARKAKSARRAPARKAAKKAAPAARAVASKPPTARTGKAARGGAGRRPNLDRPRRTVADIHGVPSSLDMGRDASAARSGRAELEQKLHEHTSTSPALTAGDVDADWGAAESVGDEAPGGDNPTPDQDVVDEIGRALGVEYDDDEELQGGDEIAARDRHRWELDPGSSDDFEER